MICNVYHRNFKRHVSHFFKCFGMYFTLISRLSVGTLTGIPTVDGSILACSEFYIRKACSYTIQLCSDILPSFQSSEVPTYPYNRTSTALSKCERRTGAQDPILWMMCLWQLSLTWRSHKYVYENIKRKGCKRLPCPTPEAIEMQYEKLMPQLSVPVLRDSVSNARGICRL